VVCAHTTLSGKAQSRSSDDDEEAGRGRMQCVNPTPPFSQLSALAPRTLLLVPPRAHLNWCHSPFSCVPRTGRSCNSVNQD
jgi:hypothetical protein